MQIVIATHNKKKLKEISAILANDTIQFLTLDEFPEIGDIAETGTTFVENSLIKAKYVYEQTGLPAIGDDSGLEIEQLDGRPGVYSARYSGEGATDEKNNKKIISELSAFQPPHKARFVCAAVYFDGKNTLVSEGYFPGEIIHTPRGHNGFGYDPHFLPDGYKITLAEMDAELKNSISHRYAAFSKLKEMIRSDVKK